MCTIRVSDALLPGSLTQVDSAWHGQQARHRVCLAGCAATCETARLAMLVRVRVGQLLAVPVDIYSMHSTAQNKNLVPNQQKSRFTNTESRI